MDMNRLEELIYEAIVEEVATRVVEALQARSRKAVVLFTGTELGLDKAAPGLQTLKADGFDLHTVLTAGARKTLTTELRQSFGLDALLAGTSDVAEPEADALLDGRGLLLIPTLSITTAAKVACCIRDCLGATLVARALERGIPVIAAIDGCCPDNPKRQADLFMVSEAYKARLRTHLADLQSYGIQLVRAGKLAEATRARMRFSASAVASAATACMAATPGVEPVSRSFSPEPVALTMPRPAVSPAPLIGEKRLFSRTDALDCTEGSELRLERNVLITPLAMDVLRARNVRIITTGR